MTRATRRPLAVSTLGGPLLGTVGAVNACLPHDVSMK
ncbi:hypothetical protein ABIE44_001160 [Marmoricola sp. OAE513]